MTEDLPVVSPQLQPVQSVIIFLRCEHHERGVTLNESPLVFETLRPEGVWFSGVYGVRDRETADWVLERISKWS